MTLSHCHFMTLSHADHHMQEFQHYEFANAASTESEHSCPADNEANPNQHLSRKVPEIPRSLWIRMTIMGGGVLSGVSGEWQASRCGRQRWHQRYSYMRRKQVIPEGQTAMGQLTTPVARLFGVVSIGKPVSDQLFLENFIFIYLYYGMQVAIIRC